MRNDPRRLRRQRLRQVDLFRDPVDVDVSPEPPLRLPNSRRDPFVQGLIDWLESVRAQPDTLALLQKGRFSEIVAAKHGNVEALHVAYAATSDRERCKFWREVNHPELAQRIEARIGTGSRETNEEANR